VPPASSATPAIVAQNAVRRLPRGALLLLCVTYVVAGFVGRSPWRNSDVSAFGYMLELAGGRTDWFAPMLAGMPSESEGLLPYWLGAWALRIAPAWIAPDLAARVPFALLLGLTLAATWYGVYALARSPRAQPVAFAFGGEARPVDYARAMADGGLLALIACLGLAQLSHEVTAHVTQLCFTTLAFYALASASHRLLLSSACLAAGLAGLALSGAPMLACLFGLGGLLLTLCEWRQARASLAPPVPGEAHPDGAPPTPAAYLRWAGIVAAITVASALLAWAVDAWAWRARLPEPGEWRSLGKLLLWFTWPAWPLGLWTLWRWRRQIASPQVHRHLALPLWFVATALGAMVSTDPSDRALLLGLPALATLAAFALPTLRRSVSALIDWFTLLFFSSAAIGVWVVWIAMMTGVPRQPAANVARLAPGFVPTFSAVALVVALAATAGWLLLVKWRVGRHRAAIWKSLVLPAGGAALVWVLLMTLWLPALDYGRSYAAQVQRLAAIAGHPSCAEFLGLSRGQVAALQFHGDMRMVPARDADASAAPRCDWLVTDRAGRSDAPGAVDPRRWQAVAEVERPVDRFDTLRLYRRIAP
jgi:4-amino-4-deoxy-L-arabinose transferase-like glycosyltransferase